MSERITEHGEVVEAEAIVVSEHAAPAPLTLFRTEDPDEIMAKAAKFAAVLARAVKAQGLSVNIQGKEYVKVEGWTLLGSLLGVFPVVNACGPVPDSRGPNGSDWQATVEARTRDGSVVGSAVAVCTRAEKRWAKAEDYAVASMAQTRATSKALRLPLGFVMQLAGYDPCPAEEIPREGFQNAQEPARAQGNAKPGTAAAPPAKDALDERGRPKGHAYHECPSCHKEAVRVNPVEGAEPHAYCWKKAGGCGASYTTSLWAVVSVPGPSALDPPPPRAARREAPADDIDLTDDQNLPF